MVLAQRPLTLEEFLQLPEEKPALEYLDGEVTRKMSPKGPHGRLQFVLARWFEDLTRPRGLVVAFTETRVTLDGASFVPDLIVYRSDRVPSDERGDIAEDFHEPPDVAVEIGSPGQTLKDLVERCRWYVEHGVHVALLVLPRTRSARVFRAGTELGPLRGADRIDLGDVLPGFELAVGELFGALRARPA